MRMDNLVKENESLRGYNTYCTGGEARYFAQPANVAELEQLLVWADALDIPHELLGHGSNVLISDKGYNGLVICLREFEKWCVKKDNYIFVGAGVSLNELVKFSCDNHLKGIESLAGIPGSVGGAVRMNAGAFGTEMKDVVTRVNVFQAKGSLGSIILEQKMIDAYEANFSYRKASGLIGKIVISAEIKLEDSDEDLHLRRKAIIQQRLDKQPLQYPSCGSVFKRPEGYYAGTLIEECGLKGYTIGGAQVAHKHANFIINLGDASSQDIYDLIKYVKKTVLIKKGVVLEEEVKFLGIFD